MSSLRMRERHLLNYERSFVFSSHSHSPPPPPPPFLFPPPLSVPVVMRFFLNLICEVLLSRFVFVNANIKSTL